MEHGRVPIPPVDVSPADRASAARWRASGPLLGSGAVSIVAGGIVAAVTGPTDWDHGSWVAAFLVLVTGVAQVGLGAGQAHFASAPPRAGTVLGMCLLWNAGGACVVAGTLIASPVTVSFGGALLAVCVATAAVGARGPRRPLLLAYRALLIVLLVSIPVGIALSWVRH